ncbi:MAG: hypothetical protein FWH04_01685 [Oscillospiraceae bacterium]|nr:hypothetical protein [Oscillospiraceae bacterium]
MARRKVIICTSVFFVIAALIVSYGAVAADLGKQKDPVVTLSYADELNTQSKETIEKIIDQKIAAILGNVSSGDDGNEIDPTALLGQEGFLNAVIDGVYEKMASNGAVTQGGTGFRQVDVKKGKTVIMGLGSMALVRKGDAVCVASGVGLIDTTAGNVLEGGKKLVHNHMYFVTVDQKEGRGFSASNDLTVFIWGDYSIK